VNDDTILYVFLYPSGRRDLQLVLGPDQRVPVLEWLRNWKNAAPGVVARGLELTRTGYWEGKDVPAWTAIQLRCGNESVLLSTDVAEAWTTDLELSRPGIYYVLPPAFLHFT
jgi:hypothetical protein